MFSKILGFITLPNTYSKSQGKQELQTCLPQHYDFVSTNLFKMSRNQSNVKERIKTYSQFVLPLLGRDKSRHRRGSGPGQPPGLSGHLQNVRPEQRQHADDALLQEGRYTDHSCTGTVVVVEKATGWKIKNMHHFHKLTSHIFTITRLDVKF